jgi:hypothetical protein
MLEQLENFNLIKININKYEKNSIDDRAIVIGKLQFFKVI